MRRIRITRDNEVVHVGDLTEDVPTTCERLKEGAMDVQPGDWVSFVESRPSGALLFTHMSVHEDKRKGGLRLRMESTSFKPKGETE